MTTVGQKDANQKLIASTTGPYDKLGGAKNTGVAPNARHDQINHEYRIYNWLLVLVGLAAIGQGVRYGRTYLTLTIIIQICFYGVLSILCFLAYRAKRAFNHEQQVLVTKLFLFFTIASLGLLGWKCADVVLNYGVNALVRSLEYILPDFALLIVFPAYFYRTGKKLEEELPRN